MKTILIAAALIFLLSACGAKPVPTVDPAQVQASAMAAANTIVAMTQAAMPTETPVPPTAAATDTPQPTPTIPPIATLPVLASPTTAPAASSDDCKFLSVSKGERLAVILFNNRTAVQMGVSFYLKKNAFGDCGYWSTQVKPHGSATITNLPLGSYYVSAWTLSGNPNFQNLGYPFAVNTTDKFTINATVETISFVPY